MARVLIVDDMVSIRRIVKTLLGAMGHEVEEAANALPPTQINATSDAAKRAE
jgi:CheY-like chemotaxis protein